SCVFGCSSVLTFSLFATCSEFLSSVLDFSSSDFFSSFFLSLLDDFVSFLSSNLLPSCLHAANTKNLANINNNNFFISHSPFSIFIYIIQKNMKKKTILPKINFRKNDKNGLTSEKPWCKVVIKTSEVIQK